MTIIHISTAITWRGGEQQVAYLLTELSTLPIEQWVVCPKGSALADFCSKNNITFETYPKRSALGIGLALQIARLCRRVHQPLVHAHDSHAHTAAVLSGVIGLNRAPIVVHRRVSFPIKKSLFSVFKYNYSSVKHIICVSEYVKKVVAEILKNPNKAVVVYEGIDLTDIAEKQTGIIDLRSKYKLQSQHILVGNISAISPEKDYVTYVNTAEQLLAEHPDYRFFIIGDGAQREYIEGYMNQKGLTDKIFLTGFIKNAKYLLPQLDVFLFTSQLEGLPVSIMDAFAFKTPVVATLQGGVPEIVINNITGLTVAVGDSVAMANAVKLLIENNQLREAIINNAFQKIQQFSVKNTAKVLLNTYKNIVNY